MNNVVDEVLAGSPRYTIKDNGGTTLYDNVQIDLKTQVTTAGTPLNKALFDSIQTDLNSRLLVSNKASQSEANTGTNDTKYLTPLKVQQKLSGLVTTASQTGAGTCTICNFADYPNASIVTIRGWLTGTSSTPHLNVSGTGVRGYNSSTTFSSSSSLSLDCGVTGLSAFEFTFDLLSNSVTGIYRSKENSSRADVFTGSFGSVTSFSATVSGGSSTAVVSATVQVNL